MMMMNKINSNNSKRRKEVAETYAVVAVVVKTTFCEAQNNCNEKQESKRIATTNQQTKGENGGATYHKNNP